MAWPGTFLQVLKANDVRLVAYLPDGSLAVPSQIPCSMGISDRGPMGGLDAGQQLVARTMRPVLDTLGIAHHTLIEETNMSFVLDRSIKQAFMTQASVAFI